MIPALCGRVGTLLLRLPGTFHSSLIPGKKHFVIQSKGDVKQAKEGTSRFSKSFVPGSFDSAHLCLPLRRSCTVHLA